MTMDERIALGVLVLDKVGIVDKETQSIPRSFRSQISSFGAAVTMGSLNAAVAFFSEQGKSKTDRGLLMDALYLMIKIPKDKIDKMTNEDIRNKTEKKNLLNYVIDVKDQNRLSVKKEIIDNAVALKLAMNAYELVKDTKSDSRGDDHSIQEGGETE